MSRERQRFSIGSAHNATCAISKRWSASIWHTIKSLSLSWRQSSARMFIQPTRTYRNEEIPDENGYAKNHSVARARSAAFQCDFVRKKGCLGKSQQRRLLDLHDAPVGAFEGSWEMPHLLDGSRARDEEGGRRSYASTPRRRNKRRREKGGKR